jgi:hypothetical protein
MESLPIVLTIFVYDYIVCFAEILPETVRYGSHPTATFSGHRELNWWATEVCARSSIVAHRHDGGVLEGHATWSAQPLARSLPGAVHLANQTDPIDRDVHHVSTLASDHRSLAAQPHPQHRRPQPLVSLHRVDLAREPRRTQADELLPTSANLRGMIPTFPGRYATSDERP